MIHLLDPVFLWSAWQVSARIPATFSLRLTYVADAEANLRIGMGPGWALTAGLNYKFGDGYLPLAQFFEGPTVMLGFELDINP